MAEQLSNDTQIASACSTGDKYSSSCIICSCLITSSQRASSSFPPLSKNKSARGIISRLSNNVVNITLGVENSDDDENEKFYKKLNRFQHELFLFSSGNSSSRVGEENVGRLEADDDDDGIKTAVCSKCKDLVSTAIESKLDMDEMEAHVRELEKSVIKALSVLDRNVQRFCKELKKITKVIQASEGTESLEQRQENDRINNRDIANGKIQLLKSISSTVTKLEAFRTQNTSKSSTTNNLSSTPVKDEDQGSDKYDNNNDDDCVMEVNSNDMDFTAPSNIFDNSDHDDGGGDDSHMHLQDDFNDSDYVKDANVSTTTERRSKRIKKKKQNNSERQSSGEDQEDSLKHHPRSYLRVKGQLCPELKQFLVGMSPFKAAIVSRTFNKKKRKPRPGALSCPLKDHWVGYNPETDVLSVDNSTPIRINVEENVLECTLCPFKCSAFESENNRHNVERKMLYHILGVHLKAFTCKKCSTVLSSYTLYLQHMKMHTEGDPTCETCGKQVRSKVELEMHKWSVHMTKEERQQAKKDGKEHPNPKMRKPKVHQCQTCGKAFREPNILRKHVARVHDESKVDEKFLCPECGKFFKKQRNLTIHQRYKCVARESEDKCVNALKDENDVLIS